jgi:predicted metal-dependent TIM-barrel fold hydrolase
VEEHTMPMIRDQGFWTAMTVYPVTKNSPDRVIDLVERYGLDRMIVDASGDWGPSDPATLHDTLFQMRLRGHSDDAVEDLFYNNPAYFLGQRETFTPQPTRPRVRDH